jgi:flagellar hook-associated protein 1 FlgK
MTPDDVASAIAADSAAIIASWNSTHPEQLIDTIAVDPANDSQLIITYDDSVGDVPPLASNESDGITFSKSAETTKGVRDTITYKLNDSVEVTITEGEQLTFDVDGDGNDELVTVDKDNAIRALVYKINTLSDTKDLITAYNGDYTLDKDGNKVQRTPLDQDHYLVIEANYPGTQNSFKGEVLVTDNNSPLNDTGVTRRFVEANSTLSDPAANDIHLEIYDNEITIDAGKLKPMIDNVNDTASGNYYADYKEKLDQFAAALADLSNAFIENSDDSYIFGENASTLDPNYDQKVNIGLFSGSDVKSLAFNKNMINTLDQQKLDYLADLQWKEDIDFEGDGENFTSFSQFYRELRVDIADDHENIIFRYESQEAVRESLELTYDKLTKVDSDEQMVELIKFQSAYEANAKMITIVDEMLQTLLGIVK